MDKCLETRKYLIDWGPIESLAPLLYYGSDGFPNDGSKEGKELVAHLQSCDKCKDWLKGYATAEDFERMKRLIQYCCPQMFCAVEEPREHELSLKFVQFRDEVFMGYRSAKTRCWNSVYFLLPMVRT